MFGAGHGERIAEKRELIGYQLEQPHMYSDTAAKMSVNAKRVSRQSKK